jgi:hypothetical protein
MTYDPNIAPHRQDIVLTGDGYYMNHHSVKTSHESRMRLELKLHSVVDDKTAKKLRCPAVSIFLTLREDTPYTKGGCETGIELTLEQAKELFAVLLDITEYVVPECRGQQK